MKSSSKIKVTWEDSAMKVMERINHDREAKKSTLARPFGKAGETTGTTEEADMAEVDGMANGARAAAADKAAAGKETAEISNGAIPIGALTAAGTGTHPMVVRQLTVPNLSR